MKVLHLFPYETQQQKNFFFADKENLEPLNINYNIIHKIMKFCGRKSEEKKLIFIKEEKKNKVVIAVDVLESNDSTS